VAGCCQRRNQTDSTEQSPSWQTNSRSASQSIPVLLWNPKVHYRIHKKLSLIPILSKKNPAHTFTNYFFKIHFNIIISSAPRSSLHIFRLKYCLYFSSLPYMLHVLPMSLPVICDNEPSGSIKDGEFLRKFFSVSLNKSSVSLPRFTFNR
jgi:hypothetical protein